jgi:hypothetical protein
MPEIVFITFLAKFISQCITSNMYWISSFCREVKSIRIKPVQLLALHPRLVHVFLENIVVAMKSFSNARIPSTLKTGTRLRCDYPGLSMRSLARPLASPVRPPRLPNKEISSIFEYI